MMLSKLLMKLLEVPITLCQLLLLELVMLIFSRWIFLMLIPLLCFHRNIINMRKEILSNLFHLENLEIIRWDLQRKLYMKFQGKLWDTSWKEIYFLNLQRKKKDNKLLWSYNRKINSILITILIYIKMDKSKR